MSRTIGLIGGMSWVSTEHYYRMLNEGVAARLGGDHCARLVLWQTDFDDITALQRAGDWDRAGEVLAEGARALVAAGAELVGIAANTMHLVAGAVAEAAAPVPLVSLLDAVRAESERLGVRRLGLLGTAYTMESPDLYPPVMGAVGVEVLVPAAGDRAAIQRHTFDELTHDVVTDEARATFRRAVDELLRRGADAVVLACTEHGLVVQPDELDVPLLDSAVIHARALVDAALD